MNLRKLKNELVELEKKGEEEMKDFVKQTQEEQSRDNQGLQNKFDDKIQKVKEVTANFFFKYEKELQSLQNGFDDISSKCDDWVKNIIKPQEMNSARLFALETRMNEEENLRFRDITFVKDTIKKFIFAIEQSSISRQSESSYQVSNN